MKQKPRLLRPGLSNAYLYLTTSFSECPHSAHWNVRRS